MGPFRVISLFFKHFHMGRIFWTFHMGRYFSLKVCTFKYLSNAYPELRFGSFSAEIWFFKKPMFVKNHVFRPFWVDGGSDWWPLLKILSMQKLFFMVIEQTLKFSLESENFFFSVALFKKIDPFYKFVKRGLFHPITFENSWIIRRCNSL